MKRILITGVSKLSFQTWSSNGLAKIDLSTILKRSKEDTILRKIQGKGEDPIKKMSEGLVLRLWIHDMNKTQKTK